jgi:two-component system chemotaxis response regulator CheB
VETLQRVVRGLPKDLPAAICIVLHLHPGSPSALAAILRRASALPCRTAVDGEELRQGEIRVAPPDRHLAIQDGHVTLTVGPRENGHRPSVDVLFRSAAAARDGRVVGWCSRALVTMEPPGWV